MKKGVLIMNLGTPDSPEPSDVGRYLKEFLGDGRVIDFPIVPRKLLVNGIIVPTRKRKSSAVYKRVWTEEGSPLLLYGQSLVKKVAARLGEDYSVKLAMRYQKPELSKAMAEFAAENVSELLLLPLYPQYSSSTTGSTIEAVFKEVSKWQVVPKINVINDFFDNDDYVTCVADRAKAFDLSSYDKIFFSYHGLPQRHLNKTHAQVGPCDMKCHEKYNPNQRFCYKAACYQTTRLIAEKLGMSKDRYQVVFQSRLGKEEWIQPYAEDTLIEAVKDGAKRILFFSPAFVADCLETLDEIGVEYEEVAHENGDGSEKVDLVPSLNDDDDWADTITNMIQKEIA